MTETAKPSPLAILLAAMHVRWERGEIDAAAALARAAAPYLHPRALSCPTVSKPKPEPHRLSDAQLQLLIGAAGTGAAPEDPHEPG